MTDTFVRLGVRYRHFRAVGGRFGPGKVHLQCYVHEHHQWVNVCRWGVGPFAGYYGDRCELDEPVTCKLCLRHREASR